MVYRQALTKFSQLEAIFHSKNVHYEKNVTNDHVSYIYDTRTSRGSVFSMYLACTFEFHVLFNAIGFVNESYIYSNKCKVLNYVNEYNTGNNMFNLELKENEIWAIDYPPNSETVIHAGDILEARQVFNILCNLYDFVDQQEAVILSL